MGTDLLVEVPLLHQAVVQGHWAPQVLVLSLLLLGLRRGPLNHLSREHYLERPNHLLKAC